MGRNVYHPTKSKCRTTSNSGNFWVSVFDTSTCTQMEWFLRRARYPRDTCTEEGLRPDRRNDSEEGGLLHGKARRISLVSLRRRLRSFRDLLARDVGRGHSSPRRRKKSMTPNAETFLTSEKFILLLEDTITEKRISYIDAICHICYVHNIEIESIAGLISPKIRKLIQNEASGMNLLRKKGRKLAI